jgi:serine/threonine-protein kinase
MDVPNTSHSVVFLRFAQMLLEEGARVGPYEILSALGAGGMGEVYRAHDTKLGRDVAIKVLPELFALDPERLVRFEREAHVLASLNHPNIAAIYGLEETDGVRALVLELVEGPTLADRIAEGAIPLAEALPLARQIADALEAAHAQGIIHRDLKPANIKVRPDGTVKVLDFGLAKLAEPSSAASDRGLAPSQSPTITTPAMMTGVGVILGTAAYMAPEQAKGRAADKRSDVWAFGCVLYEMLTGNRAFEGEDVNDTLATVLKGEPDWNALPPDVPPPIRTLIQRCLAKDRRQRIADISIAQYVLDAPTAFAALAPMVAAPPQPLWRRLALFSAPALIAGVMMAAAVWLAMRPAAPPPPDPMRFTIAPPADLRLSINRPHRDVAISPDGRHVVYTTGTVDNTQLLIRAGNQLEATPLRGLTGTESPFISPDSRSIGFIRFPGSELQKVSMTGGPAITVARIQGLLIGASWGPDDTIVFATDTRATGLLSVPAGGGEPTVLTTPDAGHGELDHYWPSFLPGGRAVLFTIVPQSGLDNAQVAVLDLRNGQRKTLIRGASQAAYVETGHLVYASAGTLRAVRFDPVRLEVSGDAVPVVEQVLTKPNGTAEFSLSRTGSLVYVAGTASATTSLTWVDRAGRPTGTVGTPGPYRNPALSPDGTRVAVEQTDPQSRTQDIWIIEVASGVTSRFTFDVHNDIYPVWSPDGSRIAFGSDRDGGVFSLYEKFASGATTEVLLLKAAEGAAPYSWAPDGQVLVYRNAEGAALRLRLLPRAGTEKPHLFEETPFNQVYAQVSPTGRWIAYGSNESGRPEVYVRSFPTPGGKYQISNDGGYLPRWRRDGKELFFYSADGNLTAVPVAGETVLDVGTGVSLFRASLPRGGPGIRQQYDVTRDGQRFLLNLVADDTSTATITVVLNGTAGLKP